MSRAEKCLALSVKWKHRREIIAVYKQIKQWSWIFSVEKDFIFLGTFATFSIFICAHVSITWNTSMDKRPSALSLTAACSFISVVPERNLPRHRCFIKPFTDAWMNNGESFKRSTLVLLSSTSEHFSVFSFIDQSWKFHKCFCTWLVCVLHWRPSSGVCQQYWSTYSASDCL